MVCTKKHNQSTLFRKIIFSINARERGHGLRLYHGYFISNATIIESCIFLLFFRFYVRFRCTVPLPTRLQAFLIVLF